MHDELESVTCTPLALHHSQSRAVHQPVTHTPLFYNISHLAANYQKKKKKALLQINGIVLHHFPQMQTHFKSAEDFSILSQLCFPLSSEGLELLSRCCVLTQMWGSTGWKEGADPGTVLQIPLDSFPAVQRCWAAQAEFEASPQPFLHPTLVC